MAPRPVLASAACAAFLLAACGSAQHPTQPTPTPQATPSPSPATPAPDVHALQIASSGIGVYLETTVPVVLVHNQSTADYVAGATVHFDVLSPSGRVLTGDDVAVPPLGPGGDGVVASRLAQSGDGNTVRATVSGGTWSPSGQASTTLGATVSCGGHACPNGHHDATATVNGTSPLPGTVNAAALCVDAGGRVTGGGTATIAATARSLQVPLILSAAAVSCRVTFSSAF